METVYIGFGTSRVIRDQSRRILFNKQYLTEINSVLGGGTAVKMSIKNTKYIVKEKLKYQSIIIYMTL